MRGHRPDRARRARARSGSRPHHGRPRVRTLGAQESAENEFEQHLDLVPATLAKGLEFDHVLLAEPSSIVAAEPDRVTGLRRLYVCLTRAVTSLVVIHQAPLPDELAG